MPAWPRARVLPDDRRAGRGRRTPRSRVRDARAGRRRRTEHGQGHGSVVSSWLLDLTAAALAEDPALARFAGRVADSGEGRWTVQAAIDEGVPVPVLTAALAARFASRGEAGFQNKVLSAMRFQFGGHAEKAVG